MSDPIDVPSGQAVRLLESLREEGGEGLTLRYRFVAPAIAGGVDFEAAAGDMAHLCTEIALPEAASEGLSPHRIVVSLSEKEIAFGTTDADVTQFFEVFSVQEGACQVELF